MLQSISKMIDLAANLEQNAVSHLIEWNFFRYFALTT